MGELKEIVEVSSMERLFLLLAVVAPVAGVLIGAFLRSRARNVKRGALLGLLIGLAGPANLVLWRLYNAVTDRTGLDSVRGLIVNFALFVGVGAAVGLLIGTLMRRSAPAPVDDSTDSAASTP